MKTEKSAYEKFKESCELNISIHLISNNYISPDMPSGKIGVLGYDSTVGFLNVYDIRDGTSFFEGRMNITGILKEKKFNQDFKDEIEKRLKETVFTIFKFGGGSNSEFYDTLKGLEEDHRKKVDQKVKGAILKAYETGDLEVLVDKR